MDEDRSRRFSALPSVEKLLRTESLARQSERYGRRAVLDAVRAALEQARAAIRTGDWKTNDSLGLLQARCESLLEKQFQSALRPVFNLTGTVLHTNLGRAPLPAAAVHALRLAAGACNVEYDLTTGERGQRETHIEKLLVELTGAEAATVVNNNAAAVVLALSTLAAGHETIVSRGELVEIGGAFRIPDIMTSSGSRLCEVGTTNRTHARDYRDAIDPNTALIMRVHTSNYEIRGFTKSVPEKTLAALAHERGLPLLVDLGSGSLVDLAQYGLPHEPTPAESLDAGADLVTFSGDKLLGGPQTGLIVGRKELIDRINRNPLKRALRIDKLIMAALEAVLKLYKSPEFLARDLPGLRLLTRPASEIEEMARRLRPRMQDALSGVCEIEVEACESQIGSGSLPVDCLPSWCISIRPSFAQKNAGRFLEQMTSRLRDLPVPIIGRTHKGAIKLDLRCLEDEPLFIEQLNALPDQPAAG
ncbi:MAG: L-seryl-tRNA(Sec) selenium transferase [Gammaproteobacteria bacterium]